MIAPDTKHADRDWQLTTDLVTSVTIDNIPQSLVGKVLDTLREGGFAVEINVGPKP